MTRSDDESEFLKGATVDVELPGKPIKRVVGALDFVAVQVTVKHDQIDPATRMRKAELINDKDVVASTMVAQVAAF